MRNFARYLLPLCLVGALAGCGGYYNDGSYGYASTGYYGDYGYAPSYASTGYYGGYSYAPSYGVGFTYYGNGYGDHWRYNDSRWHNNGSGRNQWHWSNANNWRKD